ncbi:MAG TPA: Clp protease N-terminal domain-containing protein [Mycobacterium sp.]|jgi:ATP-dependent Clp protease ATP-binding subunit ClpC|nr:Clp protease N-terminal domain-containing protein [Mycobacterium sp.]
MFERFTESARRTIVLSQGEAEALMHDHVGPSHLLLGVLTAEGATAGTLLAPLGVDADAVRRQVVARHGTGENKPPGHIPFSDDSKKVLQDSLRESLALDHTYIGTEHVLLGLVSGSAPDAGEILEALGVRRDTVREAVMTRLGSAAGAEPAEP